MQANMDIQALLSAELTVKYLTKYATKGEPSRELEAKLEHRLPSSTTGDATCLTLQVSIAYIIIFLS